MSPSTERPDADCIGIEPRRGDWP